MNDNKTKLNSHFEIHDLIDDAVNNALVRRSEALIPISDEEAQNISGGKCPFPPIIHGVIIKPPPIIHGVIIKLPPIIHGVIIKPPIDGCDD